MAGPSLKIFLLENILFGAFLLLLGGRSVSAFELRLPVIYSFVNQRASLASGGTLSAASRLKFTVEPEVRFPLGRQRQWFLNIAAVLSRTQYSPPSGAALVNGDTFQAGGRIGLAHTIGPTAFELRADYLASSTLDSSGNSDLVIGTAHHGAWTLAISHILIVDGSSTYSIGGRYTTLKYIGVRDKPSVGILGGSSYAAYTTLEFGKETRMGFVVEYAADNLNTDVGGQTSSELRFGVIFRFGAGTPYRREDK
jgi:hypothetical protein